MTIDSTPAPVDLPLHAPGGEPVLEAVRWSHPAWLLPSVLSLLLTVTMGATAVFITQSLDKLTESQAAMRQSLLVYKAQKDLMSQLLDAETGQRGFLLSGRGTYLQPYYTALAELRSSRASLVASVSTSLGNVPELKVLDAAVSAKLKELDQSILLKTEGRTDEAVALVLTDSGKHAMDDVREALRSLVTAIDLQTNEQQKNIDHGIRVTYWMLSGTLVVCAVLLRKRSFDDIWESALT